MRFSKKKNVPNGIEPFVMVCDMVVGIVTEKSEGEEWKHISGSGSILGRPTLNM
jgi:hypothetical protein